MTILNRVNKEDPEGVTTNVRQERACDKVLGRAVRVDCLRAPALGITLGIWRNKRKKGRGVWSVVRIGESLLYTV